jgi:hypothetical protein
MHELRDDVGPKQTLMSRLYDLETSVAMARSRTDALTGKLLDSGEESKTGAIGGERKQPSTAEGLLVSLASELSALCKDLDRLAREVGCSPLAAAPLATTARLR